MSNVHPIQYLLGIGTYVFLLIMGIGILLSIVIGAIMGVCSKNQMAATSLTVPVMLLLAFLPMLAMFNKTIAKIAKFFYSQQIMVEKEQETHILDITKILYIEAVERKTFVYTKDDCFESKLKLYEMEERLEECGFFRASKSCLVHLRHIKSLKNDMARKLRLTMESGEQLIVSRQYADEIKRRLGVK